MTVVKRICDSVSLLEDGRVVESGPLTEVVGAFGSRLSESLLALPPAAGADSAEGGTVEVLDVGRDGELSALTTASRHFGVDFPVVAATVERLAGTTFGRWRVQVLPPLSPDEVVGYFSANGVQAGVTATTGSVR